MAIAVSAVAVSALETLLLAPLQQFWTWLLTPIDQQAAAGAAATATASAAHPPLGARVRHPSQVRPVTRPLRVVRVAEAGPGPSSAGRMVISGRLEDVCAELDRLAAQAAEPAR